MSLDWSEYPNFSKEEFDCKETGENKMQPHFMRNLQRVRSCLGMPIWVTSGYRSIYHSHELEKETPGYHTQGIAVDCFVGQGEGNYHLVELAIRFGFSGVGFSLKRYGAQFIHLDMGPRKAVWSY